MQAHTVLKSIVHEYTDKAPCWCLVGDPEPFLVLLQSTLLISLGSRLLSYELEMIGTDFATSLRRWIF